MFEDLPILTVLIVLAVAAYIFLSFSYIGPTQVGLVTKRLGRRLQEGHIIAFGREAGYQAFLLMPGLRFRPWLWYQVKKYPWVQVPADGIGVVIAQVGQPLPAGAKSARYKPEFGDFANVRAFVEQDGQQGVQRPVLPPGSLVPIHPVGFLVLTYTQTFGVPVSPDILGMPTSTGALTYESFGLIAGELQVVRIAPEGDQDYVGIVTVQEGDPLPSGDIAGTSRRLRGRRADGERGPARGRDHRPAARQQELHAQQLPGLPGLPRQRREDRAAARPACCTAPTC